MPPPKIFINYRRKLSSSSAQLLYLMLQQRFGEAVWMDEDLEGGDVWNSTILQTLDQAKVVLALIPPEWLYYRSTRDRISTLKDLERLSDLHQAGQCYVRKELERALEKGITIIPVLLDGAKLPPRDWIPESLLPVFDTYQNISLHFASPKREDFQRFFEILAEKAELDTRQLDGADDLFYQPVNNIFPLPDDLRDELPDTPVPYVGLKPFARTEARLFFGRSREIYKLCYKITREAEPRLLLLDGYSGTGKSSLLQAGIIPRLEKQGWAVAYGRREEDKIMGLSGVFTRLRAELEAKPAGRKLLILDQLEEAITNPIDVRPRELAELAELLQVAQAERPDWKFLLAFRSEYTARISRLLQDFELSFDGANTLFPLDREGILEAVQSVSNVADLHTHYRLHFIPPSLPRTIANRLAERAGYDIAPLIQVNMELLWEKCRQADGSVRITRHAIRSFIESHEDLLQHYLTKIRETITEGYADDLAVLQVLNFYVEEKPAAATRLDAEFEQHPDFGQDDRVRTLRRELERLYLLSITGAGHRRAARLTHDVLATTISHKYLELNTRLRRRAEEQSFELLFEKLPQQLYVTEYEKAQETLSKLMELGIRRKELRPYLYELLFFWKEAGTADFVQRNLQYFIDSGLLSEAALQHAKEVQQQPERAAVDRWLAEVDPKAYSQMQHRYLAPEETYLVEVVGGSFTRKEQEIQIDTFFLANVPVTFWKYSLYARAAGVGMPKAPRWDIRGDHPVVNVSWWDAIQYCNWLSARYGLPEVYEIRKDKAAPQDQKKWSVIIHSGAPGFRLPSEAEWEYAARGGRRSRGFQYAGSNNLKEVGWYTRNSDNQTHPVAQKQANELGLFDMSGNVWEWCADNWHDNFKGAPQDGRPWIEGGAANWRVVRGGSWYSYDNYCRVSVRNYYASDFRFNYLGFRVARY